jgi:hypothetical protein
MDNPVQVRYNPYQGNSFYLNNPNFHNEKIKKVITEANSTVVMKKSNNGKGKVYIDYNKEFI